MGSEKSWNRVANGTPAQWLLIQTGEKSETNEGFHCFVERGYEVLTEKQDEFSAALPDSYLADNPPSLHVQVEMPYRLIGG
ncbi:hypothetical protein Q5P01_013368 [Channa striata]|uniref:Uncharacterized protein n=1 Tax=Channa striata TaxID=64152 RepID=A0AA88MK13_CHASR|nr:hypothetical protein Q5P01_013368 [Channa striata]